MVLPLGVLGAMVGIVGVSMAVDGPLKAIRHRIKLPAGEDLGKKLDKVRQDVEERRNKLMAEMEADVAARMDQEFKRIGEWVDEEKDRLRSAFEEEYRAEMEMLKAVKSEKK
jgi:hypothetical protein